MLPIIRNVFSLLVSTVFLLMGSGLLHSTIALHGRALGFPVVLIGVLTSAYYVGFLAGTYFVPRLTHRIGHIRSFAFCVMLVTLTVQFQVVTPIYPVWLGTRVLQGLSLVGLYAVIESWLSASTTRQHRSALFAIYMMLNLGAGALAQQFLRLDGDAFALFNVITTLFCAAGLPIIATRQRQPAVKQMPRIRLPHLWQQTPIALVASLVSGLILGSLWGLLPLYAQARGLDMGQIELSPLSWTPTKRDGNPPFLASAKSGVKRPWPASGRE